jgi:hypothetical protein
MRKHPTNSHLDHPERGATPCPWSKCGKLHMEHTKLYRSHVRSAARELWADPRDVALTMYNAIADAETLREARAIAAGIWRSRH